MNDEHTMQADGQDETPVTDAPATDAPAADAPAADGDNAGDAPAAPAADGDNADAGEEKTEAPAEETTPAA